MATNLIGRVAYLAFRAIERLQQWSYEQQFRSLACLAPTARALLGARIINSQDNPSAIVVGENTVIRGELFVFGHGGRIELGEWCYIGEGSRIWSAASIKMGNRVLVAHNVNIHDSISHSTRATWRHEHAMAIFESGHPRAVEGISATPVVIGNDVWIGFDSVILKGVSIGDGAIVGAGSFVTHDVEPWTVVAGIPAKVVRHIATDER